MQEAVLWEIWVTVCYGNPPLNPVPAVLGRKGGSEGELGRGSPEAEARAAERVDGFWGKAIF